MAGLPVAAWLAAMRSTDDPERLRRIVVEACENYEALHAEAERLGIRLPRRWVPTQAMRRNPQ